MWCIHINVLLAALQTQSGEEMQPAIAYLCFHCISVCLALNDGCFWPIQSYFLAMAHFVNEEELLLYIFPAQ